MSSDETRLCKAKHTPNFGKPCVPVIGVYDGLKLFSCSFCGRWIIEEHDDQLD